MENFELLRKEMRSADLDGPVNIRNVIPWQGYKKHYNLSRIRAKAEAKTELFSSMPKKVYKHDLVLGSMAGIFSKSANPAELSYADRVCESYGINDFETNRDHFTPDFEYFLAKGIGGVIKDIEISRSKYASDPSKSEFLACCKICLEGLSSMALSYADTAEKHGKTAEGKICRNIVKNPPQSFREALQLVWLIEESFFAEGRDAMALGRMDMYLFPFYENDVKKGRAHAGICRTALGVHTFKNRRAQAVFKHGRCNKHLHRRRKAVRRTGGKRTYVSDFRCGKTVRRKRAQPLGKGQSEGHGQIL